MCSWEPYTSSISCARALWHRIGPCCGLWGAQDAKNHAARPCLRDNLITFSSMVIFARLNMQLGAIRERQQQRESTLAQMSTHVRGGRHNTAQIAKSESQRTSPSVWASSPLGALVHAAPRGLAAAQLFYVGAILNRDPTVRGKKERNKEEGKRKRKRKRKRGREGERGRRRRGERKEREKEKEEL